MDADMITVQLDMVVTTSESTVVSDTEHTEFVEMIFVVHGIQAPSPDSFN